MKKRKKKSKKILLLFVLVLTFLIYQNYPYLFDNFITNFSDYNIIYEKENANYAGRGQQESKNSDGYFTTFTTEEKHQKTYKEYKQNGPASWHDKSYWGRNNGRKWLWHYSTFYYFEWLWKKCYA